MLQQISNHIFFHFEFKKNHSLRNNVNLKCFVIGINKIVSTILYLHVYRTVWAIFNSNNNGNDFLASTFIDICFFINVLCFSFASCSRLKSNRDKRDRCISQSVMLNEKKMNILGKMMRRLQIIFYIQQSLIFSFVQKCFGKDTNEW